MWPILNAEHLPTLKAHLWPKCLLVFDYDGTLAPIVEDRSQAMMRSKTQELIVSVSKRCKTAVVSGRALRELQSFLNGVPLFDLIGNHGAESGASKTPPDERVERWSQMLEEELGAVNGVEVENKRHTLSIHYRNSKSPSIERRVMSAALNCRGARLMNGKKALNIVPLASPGIAEALQSMVARSGAEQCIFVGDEAFDEEIFRLKGKTPILGIRVERSDTSAASYYIDGQDKIDQLLYEIQQYL